MLLVDSPEDSILSRLQEIIYLWRFPLLVLLVGLSILALIILNAKGFFSQSKGEIKVIEATSSALLSPKEFAVEVGGAVENPGVYYLPVGSRVEDAIDKAGGMRTDADFEWISQVLNRAAKITDGQKIFIPIMNTHAIPEKKQDDVLSANNLPVTQVPEVSRTIITQPTNNGVNINTATISELDKLPGIGPVYAQKIIDHRPYSNIEELLTKKVIPQKTFEKIQGEVSVY